MKILSYSTPTKTTMFCLFFILGERNFLDFAYNIIENKKQQPITTTQMPKTLNPRKEIWYNFFFSILSLILGFLGMVIPGVAVMNNFLLP